MDPGRQTGRGLPRQERRPPWYINGNVNLAETETEYLAWRLTGESAYHDAYERSWTFTISPPQTRWPGYGLQTIKAPTKADGSDGAAYLAEAGAGGLGYDPEYTGVQLDAASRLYALTRDERFLKLSNMLLNQIRPRIDATGSLDTSGGTRHTEANRAVPFLSPGPSVVSFLGGRNDLNQLLSEQALRISKEYAQFLSQWHPNFYRGVGLWLSVAYAATRDGQNASPSGGITTTTNPVAVPTTTPAPTPAATKPVVVAKAPPSKQEVAKQVPNPKPIAAKPNFAATTSTAQRRATTAQRRHAPSRPGAKKRATRAKKHKARRRSGAKHRAKRQFAKKPRQTTRGRATARHR